MTLEESVQHVVMTAIQEVSFWNNMRKAAQIMLLYLSHIFIDLIDFVMAVCVLSSYRRKPPPNQEAQRPTGTSTTR